MTQSQPPATVVPVGPRRRREAPVRRARDHERGGALVELALILPLFLMIVFGAVDIGRFAQLQNRLANAAREGAAAAQLAPRQVSSGCDGTDNVTDRAEGQDQGLTDMAGFAITVAWRDPSSGTWRPVAGCNADSAPDIEPGDRVRVTVSAGLDMMTPTGVALFGSTTTVSRTVDAVVQG